jgi:hypothetical protein
MKDRKSLYLLIFALTVVTISFVLISIWGYHFYFTKNNTTAALRAPVSQTVQQAPVVVHKPTLRDSLQTILNLTAQRLVTENDSAYLDSSADKTLAVKLIELNRLKNEIAEILKNKSASEDTSSNEKISKLQQSVEELKKQNNEVAQANERLSEMVKKLIEKKGCNAGRTSSPLTEKHLAGSAYSLPLLVSHLRFVALSVNNDKKETNIAAKTERLYGSFQINAKPDNRNNAIYVVIIQPDGKILLNPKLKSGTFKTKTGSSAYSTVLHFDNTKDNGNRLVFSIDSPNFQKGKYAMQIYHEGVLIGRLTRILF